MFVTVIICTRNRASQLCNVLDSFVAMDKPSEDWEMLLVDNGSSDNTQEVINSYKDKLPIRSVIEETPGLSNARNTGVKNATGEYICWTDDDVKVDTKWLVGYVEAFKKHPDAVVFGGVIEPVAETEFPKWWVENFDLFEDLMAKRDFGDKEILFGKSNKTTPYGANFAIKTEANKRHLYNVNLGVSPNFKRLGEETDVISKIIDEGASGLWTPKPIVKHIIPAARLTKEYLATYSQSAGQTFAYLYKTDGQNNMMPLWIIRRYLTMRLMSIFKKENLFSREWLQFWLDYNYIIGAWKYFTTN